MRTTHEGGRRRVSLPLGRTSAYKDYESARPRTTSRNESVRILLLFMPIFMYNAWCLAKHLAQASCHAARVTLKGLLKLFCRFILDPYQTAFTHLTCILHSTGIDSGHPKAAGSHGTQDSMP